MSIFSKIISILGNYYVKPMGIEGWMATCLAIRDAKIEMIFDEGMGRLLFVFMFTGPCMQFGRKSLEHSK